MTKEPTTTTQMKRKNNNKNVAGNYRDFPLPLGRLTQRLQLPPRHPPLMLGCLALPMSHALHCTWLLLPRCVCFSVSHISMPLQCLWLLVCLPVCAMPFLLSLSLSVYCCHVLMCLPLLLLLYQSINLFVSHCVISHVSHCCGCCV
jgi:hypothetical protein